MTMTSCMNPDFTELQMRVAGDSVRDTVEALEE